MALAKWQAHVVDDSGDVQDAAEVTVRIQSTNDLASIYTENTGTTPKDNPFTTGSDGLAAFFAAGNVYKIVATKGALTRTWEDVSIGSAQALDEDSIQELVDEGIAGLGISGVDIEINGGGSEIPTGIKADIRVPFDCEITGHTLLADQTGSIVIDLWKDTYANFPPTDADSITASAPPTISSGVKATDTTLTGWTVALDAGDIIRVNVDSVTDVQRCVLSLHLVKT